MCFINLLLECGNLRLSKAIVFEELMGLVFWGTMTTGAAHKLKLLGRHLASSNKCISPLMNLCYLSGIGYGWHAMGSPVVRISIQNRLVVPTSMGNLDTMLPKSFSSSGGSLSLASCVICASHRITTCFKLFCLVGNLIQAAYPVVLLDYFWCLNFLLWSQNVADFFIFDFFCM